MMTNDNNMFEFDGTEFPLTSSVDISPNGDEGGSCWVELEVVGPDIPYCIVESEVEAFYLAKHTAQLKAQGWTAPMPPLCMRGALEVGYKFKKDVLYLIHEENYRPVITYVKSVKLKLANGESINGYKADMVGLLHGTFTPCLENGQPDPVEYQRAIDAGVPVYEEGK